MDELKVNIKFNDIILENIYLPFSLLDFRVMIMKEFALEENDILNYIIIAFTENEKYEMIDSEDNYSKIKDQKINEIYIIEKNFNHGLFCEKAKTFDEKVQKVIEEQLLIAAKNIKVLLFDKSTEEKKKNNCNKVNRTKHEIKCSQCKKEEIYGYYYICTLCYEQKTINFCSECAENHDHPLFKIF